MGIKTGNGGGNVQFFSINQKLGCFTSGSGASNVEPTPKPTRRAEPDPTPRSSKSPKPSADPTDAADD